MHHLEITCITYKHIFHCSDARQNKGSILKASVDHIRRLHREMDKVKTFEHKQRQLEESNRVMQMRIRVRSPHDDLKVSVMLHTPRDVPTVVSTTDKMTTDSLTSTKISA